MKIRIIKENRSLLREGASPIDPQRASAIIKSGKVGILLLDTKGCFGAPGCENLKTALDRNGVNYYHGNVAATGDRFSPMHSRSETASQASGWKQWAQIFDVSRFGSAIPVMLVFAKGSVFLATRGAKLEFIFGTGKFGQFELGESLVDTLGKGNLDAVIKTLKKLS